MSAILCVVLLLALWGAAVVFWVLDAPDTRTVTELLLQEPALEELQRA